MKAIVFLALIALSLCGKRETVVACAKETLGTRYETFDFTTLVRLCYKRIQINVSSVAHYIFDHGKAVPSQSALKPGDIVGFNNHDGKPQPGHVGIYIGGDQYIHSPGHGKTVTYGTLSTNRNYYGGRNYID